MTDLTKSGRPSGAVGHRLGLADRPGRATRPGLVLAVVLTGQIMAIIDTNIVNVAVPAMHATLGASGASLQLTVAGFTMSYAVPQVPVARPGDIPGLPRVVLGGVEL